MKQMKDSSYNHSFMHIDPSRGGFTNNPVVSQQPNLRPRSSADDTRYIHRCWRHSSPEDPAYLSHAIQFVCEPLRQRLSASHPSGGPSSEIFPYDMQIDVACSSFVSLRSLCLWLALHYLHAVSSNHLRRLILAGTIPRYYN